jgi:hypothetical protein
MSLVEKPTDTKLMNFGCFMSTDRASTSSGLQAMTLITSPTMHSIIRNPNYKFGRFFNNAIKAELINCGLIFITININLSSDTDVYIDRYGYISYVPTLKSTIKCNKNKFSN